MDLNEHVRLFNSSVESSTWATFVDRFTEDAEMHFIGVPVGPFIGRPAIARGYTTNPPDDAIELVGEPTIDADETMTAFRWRSSGATGSMRFREQAGRIARLDVTFD